MLYEINSAAIRPNSMFGLKKIIDVSVDLNNKTVIYPGTPELQIKSLKSPTTGSELSKITLSSHVGTHLDAPRHALKKGKTIDQINLATFIGACRVVDSTKSRRSISLDDVKKIKPKKGERLLFKTSNSKRGFTMFYEDFIYLSPEAAKYLAENKVSLVGIDSFSIKQKGSKDNRPHTELLSKNIPLLEGINLSKVNAGVYYLVCLPLKFIGIDGSPCRAVLLK